MAEFYVTPGKIGQGHDNNQREKKSDLPQLRMEIEKMIEDSVLPYQVVLLK